MCPLPLNTGICNAANWADTLPCSTLCIVAAAVLPAGKQVSPLNNSIRKAVRAGSASLVADEAAMLLVDSGMAVLHASYIAQMDELKGSFLLIAQQQSQNSVCLSLRQQQQCLA
eukprot:CAMPEP_0170085522 /NCGR_PEP_ID=MMETSP0019_2-20121128/20380_1 /TAXON_ID=98059 /ORGANISM="Dinobryon sp., Strain UTEXLB2267" /LENGTH=113 /DNA_ID=CAMNT_0010302017 /DNA_START=246 /DNA_END=586 /DNA_ORIENTATION=-